VKLVCLATAGAVAFGFTACSWAQDRSRTIEETLVVKDPTVAQRGQWLLGGAFEELYIYGPYRARVIDDSREKGTIHGFKPGFNGFVGYGDLSLNYVYRRGTETVSTHHDATNQVPVDFDHTRRFKTKENELGLRWRLRDLDTSWYSPYVYAGYLHLSSDNTDTVTAGNFTFGNGTTEERSRIVSDSAYLGLGAIFPWDEKKGVRLDGAVNYTKARWELETSTLSGHGFGGRATGTFYYVFSEGWNAQMGARFDAMRAPPVFYRYRFGVFVMLGYTHRF
jgi:hypothetical protein